MLARVRYDRFDTVTGDRTLLVSSPGSPTPREVGRGGPADPRRHRGRVRTLLAELTGR